MKRRTVHLLFGALSLTCAAVAVFQTWHLGKLKAENQQLAQLRSAVEKKNLAVPAAGSNRLALAYANALARAGEIDAAVEAYSRLRLQEPESRTGLNALFNLGNLHFRQGLLGQRNGKPDFLPDIELAKQRYRDLLRIDPDNWDARYNLEQALRLAPEQNSALSDAEKDIKERRRIKLRGMSSVQLP